jgi:hypothetical protein
MYIQIAYRAKTEFLNALPLVLYPFRFVLGTPLSISSMKSSPRHKILEFTTFFNR